MDAGLPFHAVEIQVQRLQARLDERRDVAPVVLPSRKAFLREGEQNAACGSVAGAEGGVLRVLVLCEDEARRGIDGKRRPRTIAAVIVIGSERIGRGVEVILAIKVVVHARVERGGTKGRR